jgi:hypothetical protein
MVDVDQSRYGHNFLLKRRSRLSLVAASRTEGCLLSGGVASLMRLVLTRSISGRLPLVGAFGDEDSFRVSWKRKRNLRPGFPLPVIFAR